MPAKAKPSKRELIDTGTDKRYMLKTAVEDKIREVV